MSSAELVANAKLFKLLGHSKRLEIATLLHGHELTVGQIAQMTSLRQATVSQHLILLKRSHLVSSLSIGKEIYYSLSSDRLFTLSLFLDRLTKAHPSSDVEPTVVDPICQMILTPSTAHTTCEYNGVRHYFCGRGCLKEFHANHQI
jgi:DNA-binding transcriptional ArsR family regulator